MKDLQKYLRLVLNSERSLSELQIMLYNHPQGDKIKEKIKEVMMFLAQSYELQPSESNQQRIQQCKILLEDILIQAKLYDLSLKHKPNDIIVSPCNKVMYCRTFTDDHFPTCEFCKREL